MVYLIDVIVMILACLWRQGKILRENPAVHDRWMRAMCMGRSEADRVVARHRKQRIYLFYLIFGGCMLSLGISIWQNAVRTEVTALQRPEYGSGSQLYRLRVEGLNEKPEQLELEVAEQQVSPQEEQQFLELKLDRAEQQIWGNQDSPKKVWQDLSLPSAFEGIRLKWTSLTPEVISDWGEVMTDELPEEGVGVWLQAEASYQGAQCTRLFQLTVLPPEQNAEETRLQGLKQIFAAKEEADQQTEILLPEEYQGRSLTFYWQEDNLALQICLFSLLLASVFFFYFRQLPEKKLKERSRQLEYDYVEVVTRLTIYVRAGMSIRGAWERIAQEYMVRRQEGAKIHYAYEEMLISCYRMESGIPEGAAYGEFGRQCGIHSYMRLSGLLEQNVRKGGTELLRLLEQEAGEAFEAQKNMARKIGEEAETKLLLPMGMMLGVILIILIVPIFTGFTI